MDVQSVRLEVRSREAIRSQDAVVLWEVFLCEALSIQSDKAYQKGA